MNTFWKNIHRNIQSISMTETERARVRGAIQSYMLKHPAYTPSPLWSVFLMRPAVAGLAGLVILLGSGAGLSFASQESLPNESLYPIKIFQEDIVSLTKTTPKEKADYSIMRVEKRIQEATVLAKTNKLEPEMKQKIADTIAKHVEDVETQTRVVEKVSPELALETTTQLETSLETNVKALEVLTPTEEKSEDPILAIVETKAEDAHTTKVETALIVQENPSEDIRIKAEGKLTTIKNEIEHLDIVSIEPLLPVAPDVLAPKEEIVSPTLNSGEGTSIVSEISAGEPTSKITTPAAPIDASISSQSGDLVKISEPLLVIENSSEIVPISLTTKEVPTEPTRDIFMSELVKLYSTAEHLFNTGDYGQALVILQSIEQMIQSQKTISTLEQTYQVEIPTQLIEVPALSVLEKTDIEVKTENSTPISTSQSVPVSESVTQLQTKISE